MAQFSSDKDKAKKMLEAHQSRLKKITDGIAEKEGQVAEIRENAHIAEQAALQNCARIETKRKRKEVESELRKLKSFIEKQQPRAEEQDLIRQEYSDAMELLEETIAKIKQQKKALKVSPSEKTCVLLCGVYIAGFY